MGVEDIDYCDTNLTDAHDYLRRTMWHMEMPFSSANVLDDVLNRRAWEGGTTVVLEGQGSDESQAGYFPHYIAYLAELFNQGKWIKGIQSFRQARWPQQTTLRSRVARELIKTHFKTIVHSYKHLRPSPYEALSKYLTEGVIKKNYFEGTSQEVPFSSELNNALYEDIYGKLQRVLRYKDRISMAYSRELRVPFLDHNLVEFMFTIPNEYKIQSGVQKVVLKRAVADIVPDSVLNAPKNGSPDIKVGRSPGRSDQELCDLGRNRLIHGFFWDLPEQYFLASVDGRLRRPRSGWGACSAAAKSRRKVFNLWLLLDGRWAGDTAQVEPVR